MYYCKHCGTPYKTEEAIFCLKCGTRKAMGVNFCHRCSAPLQKKRDACVYCGVPAFISSTPKYRITAGLLALAFGSLGVHNFYLGYAGKATIQLCLSIIGLCTLCVIWGILILAITYLWGIIEGIIILSGGIYKDKNGVFLK